MASPSANDSSSGPGSSDPSPPGASTSRIPKESKKKIAIQTVLCPTSPNDSNSEPGSSDPPPGASTSRIRKDSKKKIDTQTVLCPTSTTPPPSHSPSSASSSTGKTLPKAQSIFPRYKALPVVFGGVVDLIILITGGYLEASGKGKGWQVIGEAPELTFSFSAEE